MQGREEHLPDRRRTRKVHHRALSRPRGNSYASGRRHASTLCKRALARPRWRVDSAPAPRAGPDRLPRLRLRDRQALAADIHECLEGWLAFSRADGTLNCEEGWAQSLPMARRNLIRAAQASTTVWNAHADRFVLSLLRATS